MSPSSRWTAASGQYTIRGVLGQGGMGVVYVAEQERPRRTVALKVMRRGVGSDKLIRRFEFEAELLGKLQHPGIAQIYEAGTFADEQPGFSHPYIAMELIRGKSLRDHVLERALGTRARLELIAKVCDAVQHAHMCGIIHRDLKPANILVDDAGQPKILDFGVARAIDRDAAVTTLHTSVGQIIGTLPYMSPEQIGSESQDIDTRSDVYSLGVVLYEVLTGRLPHQFKDRSLVEAARVIRDEAPARLSTIDRSLRGEIDTITSKAMDKDRSRRYQSAAELAADLRAYLEGRPIAAKQDSAMYILRKQLKRYRGLAAVALIFLMGLMTFAVYAYVQSVHNRKLAFEAIGQRSRAEGALGIAQAEQARADSAAESLARELSLSNIERGRLLGRSGNLTAAEELLWPEHLRSLLSHHTYFALWELYSRTRCEATVVPSSTHVNRVRLSPDGRYLAITGGNPALAIWDTASLECIAQSPSVGADVLGLAYSPKGDLVAIGDTKGRVALMDPKTAAPLAILRESGPGVYALAFDAAGDRLLATQSDGSLTLFNATLPAGPNTAPAQRSLSPAQQPIIRSQSIALNPAKPEFALACSDSRIRVFSSTDLEPLRDFENPDSAVACLAFSPDGSLLACGGSSRTTRLLDPATGKILGTLAAPNGNIAGVAFTPDGKQLLCTGWWYLQAWDVAERRLLQAIPLRSTGTDVAMTPDAAHAWCNIGGTIREWDMDPLAGQTRITVPTTRTLVCFTQTGELITGEADGSVCLIADPSGEPIQTLGKGARRVRAIALSPSAPVAATLGVDGVLYLYNLLERRQIGSWPGFRMAANDGMRFDSTGARLVLPAADNTFKVLKVPSGTVLLTLPSDGNEALSAAFSPDDSMIATTTRGRKVVLYDARTGQRIRECEPLPENASAWAVVFTPDGSRVISGSWNRTISIWNTATGALERTLEGHLGLVSDLAFRPGEPNILASSGTDGQILLWDLSLPQNTPVLTLGGFDGWEVWTLQFHPDGHRLLGTNSQGTTVIWNLRYFNRHIGGNMLPQIERYKSRLGSDLNESAALEQRRLLLSRGRRIP